MTMSHTLSPEATALVDRACARIDPQAVSDLLFDLTAAPSATGEEAALAELVVERVRAVGLEAGTQEADGRVVNAVATLGRAETDALRILVYAPLDTAFTGDAPTDEPWLGREPRADFSTTATRQDGRVVGMGAENPKAFAAAAIVALEALAREDARLPGVIQLGLCGRSMPDLGVPPRLPGFGVGVRRLLADSLPDAAIVLKPGYAVSYEEVGEAWFRIEVRGTVNYTGSRHRVPYHNPILGAARVVEAIERWAPSYTARWSDEAVSPQLSINALAAGGFDKLAFVPATAHLGIDVRIPPGLTATAARDLLDHELDGLRATDPELGIRVEELASFEGSRTDPDHWVVRSLVDAWEWREEREHAWPKAGSGASDASLIRAAGVPTARIGLPPSTGSALYPGFSMGVADPHPVARLASVLVRTFVDTASRTRGEVGLPS